LCLGVRGAVGSTYNFAAPHYHRIIRAFESGDLAKARTLQLQSAEMIQTLNSFGFMAASKAVMSLVGVDCGPVRAPIRNLTPGQLDALANQLASTEILARSVKLLA
jgi:N-acetylneuraminate lyase